MFGRTGSDFPNSNRITAGGGQPAAIGAVGDGIYSAHETIL
jgi:hypothetical protein